MSQGATADHLTGRVLLERERELALFDEALEQVCGVGAAAGDRGRGGHREGQAAVRRLWARPRAGCGVRVLVARCADLEREFSFGAVRQLFERLVAQASGEAGSNLLSGPAGLAASLLDPSLIRPS